MLDMRLLLIPNWAARSTALSLFCFIRFSNNLTGSGRMAPLFSAGHFFGFMADSFIFSRKYVDCKVCKMETFLAESFLLARGRGGEARGMAIGGQGVGGREVEGHRSGRAPPG